MYRTCLIPMCIGLLLSCSACCQTGRERNIGPRPEAVVPSDGANAQSDAEVDALWGPVLKAMRFHRSRERGWAMYLGISDFDDLPQQGVPLFVSSSSGLPKGSGPGLAAIDSTIIFDGTDLLTRLVGSLPEELRPSVVLAISQLELKAGEVRCWANLGYVKHDGKTTKIKWDSADWHLAVTEVPSPEGTHFKQLGAAIR